MSVSDRDVMQLYDGELDPERARAVERARVDEPSIGGRLAALAQLSAFTREWARSPDGARVVGAVRPVRERPRRSVLGFGAAAVLISLGAVCFLPQGPAAGAREGGGGLAQPDEQRIPSPAVQVENVDFGAYPGTIFSVRGAGTETTVVWLSDDADGAPSAAL